MTEVLSVSPYLEKPLRGEHQVKWEVGKTYLTRGKFDIPARVRILATDARGPMPIVGMLLGEEGEGDSVFMWAADGRFTTDESDRDSSLDLTTDLAP